MRTGSVNWGLSSLLRRRLMSLMHRSVCWTSNIVCGCCEHLTYTFWWLRDSSVMLNGLELRHRRRFRNVAEHMRCFEGWNWNFRLVPTSRGIRPPTMFLACKLREKSSIVELVLRLSEYNNHLNRVGVDLPDEIVMFLRSHYHQAARASWWTIIYQGHIWWSLRYSRCLTPQK